MTNFEDELNFTDYMIRRSLTILLSDLRRWKKGLSTVPFKIIKKDDNNSNGSPMLLELLLIFNIWRSTNVFSETIIESISIPHGWYRKTKTIEAKNLQGKINWPKTFEHRQKGGEGFVIRDFGRKVVEAQAQYVAFILSEFQLHSKIIIEKVTNSMGMSAPEYMYNIIKDVDNLRGKINKIATQFKKFEKLNYEKLQKAECALLSLFENHGDGLETVFSNYREVVPLNRPKGTFITNIVRNLESWRDDYLNCKVAICEGDIFQYHRGGNIADLYELWCFFEICAAIKRKKLEDVVQLCAIKRRQNIPQFKLGEEKYVYFDFHSLSFSPIDKNQIFAASHEVFSTMPGVFVEWFIKDLDDYHNSICMDTKYANWESREVLKVLGYMTNYGIRNGVLIMKDKIIEATIGGELIYPGLRRIKFPDRKTLWVISLSPNIENEEANNKILNHFVSEKFKEKLKSTKKNRNNQ